jgi:DNA polymerase alpha subunit B
VEGTNSSGRTMQATRLIEGAVPPSPPPSSPALLEPHQQQQQGGGGGGEQQQQQGEHHPLSIMAVAGPFTTNDNLDYDPFIDVLMTVLKNAPDVVILCGPFVDERQPLVSGENNDGMGGGGGGGPTMTNDCGEEVTVSYEYLFAKNISELLEDLYEKEPELKTQFVLVPSLDDAFVDAVYPQPPFSDGVNDDDVVKVPKGSDAEGKFGDLGLQYVEKSANKDNSSNRRRVHCVSNPSTLQINDVTIGVTSTDILFHISSEECNANLPPGTRLAHIAQHLVQQRSYYPLFPPAKGASLDLSKSKEWEMAVKPDILIVPSKLTSFARQVLDTTVVVNPGELTKNVTGGTYAVIDVHPRKRDDEIANQQGVQDRVRVDIKRI